VKPLSLLLLALLPAAGCGVECGDASQTDGKYVVFTTVNGSPDISDPEHFPYYSTPVNGWGEWVLDWHGLDTVSVLIDGEVYEAQGSWDAVECGNFTLKFNGAYEWSAELNDRYHTVIDTEHDFNMFLALDVFGTRMEGTWVEDEQWTDPGGVTGTFAGHGLVSGARISN
jgi:hypothetical protein